MFCNGADRYRQTDRKTDGYGDSMTESAQRADAVKSIYIFLFSNFALFGFVAFLN